MTAASLHDRLLARVAELDPSVPIDREAVSALVVAEAPLLDAPAVQEETHRLLSAVRGLGPLDPLLADPAVTELMVNGPGPVWVERHGRLEATTVSVDRASVEAAIERIVGPLGLRADRTAPMVDARLADGSRVNAVMAPLAIDGPYLTIRRFSPRALPVSSFAPAEVERLLLDAVGEGRNIVVSGGTASGKTTLLNALAAAIPSGQRIVTIEDAAELRLPQAHVVRLEARPANSEGAGAVSVRDLVRNALRMRPDRIVVGECRGAEALDMLQALNTGHDGSLSTCHANSPADALRRLETMVLLAADLPLVAVREQLVAAIDLVVQVVRRRGRRHIVEVCEVAAELDGGGRPSLRRLWGPDGPGGPPRRPARIGVGR